MAIWKDKFINVNKYARSGKKLQAVRKIVLHWTANFGASAENHYKYFNTLKDRYASAHFFVDKKEALCILPLDEVAYHCNDIQQRDNKGNPYRGVAELKPNANLLSIGIEMCVEKDGTIHADTIKRAEDVAVELCKKYKLDPQTDIVRHYDITHKSCPTPFITDASKLKSFKDKVEAKLNPPKITPVKAPAKPVEVKALGTVKVLVDSLWYYNKADWNAKEAMADKGDVFTVVAVVNVNGYNMYKLKSGMYITASERYVEFNKK